MQLNRVCVAVSAAVCLALAACGGGQPADNTGGAPAPTASPVDAATAATITGKVVLEGEPPKPEVIQMDADPACSSDGPQMTEYYVVSGDHGLDNVFVFVKSGLGDLKFPVPTTPVVLDQQGCRYHPHVAGVEVGQPLEVVNGDDTLHNVHAVPTVNAEFNAGQPIKGMKLTHTFTAPEVMIPFKCDVHGWMSAYVGVVDNPYYAVSADGGGFSLKSLPPGTYEIEAWHEKLGTQTQTVTVGPKETKDITFTFKMGD